MLLYKIINKSSKWRPFHLLNFLLESFNFYLYKQIFTVYLTMYIYVYF